MALSNRAAKAVIVARTEEQSLRKCPTCGGEYDDLGMRDFRWLAEILPGKAGATDLDCLIHHWKRHAILLIETSETKWVPRGKAILLDELTDSKVPTWDIYIVVDKHFPHLLVSKWGHPEWKEMHIEEFSGLVRFWWEHE